MRRITSGQLGITLRPVKRVVWGRENRRGRVTYQGQIPEQVVLRRWREAGFHGHRLRPNVWRVLGQMPGLRRGATLEEIRSVLLRTKQEGGQISKILPRAELVFDVFAAVSSSRLKAIIERHRRESEVDPVRPGVADLFLFKRRSDGAPYGVRFVEVKRPDERLQPHQIAELRFMRSIGFRAGVVRLLERPAPARVIAGEIGTDATRTASSGRLSNPRLPEYSACIHLREVAAIQLADGRITRQKDGR